MKKLTKKLSFVILLATLLITLSSISTAFAADKTMSITLRIEGIEKNLYYETVDVPYSDNLTLQNTLTYVDAQEDSITITGADTAYITDINGEAAAKFGGWDGWLYKVNGQEAVIGIDSLDLADGDSVVLYYGDPYGAGMQFPVADTSDIEKGVITFTSSDTTYDANYKATVTVNPIVDATVTWSNGDTDTEYVTDKNGSIVIDAEQLTAGTHSVQISKIGDSTLPLVLRLAPDYTVTVNSDNSVTTSGDDASSDADNTTDGVAATGETITATIAFFVFAVLALAGVIFFRRKENYEK